MKNTKKIDRYKTKDKKGFVYVWTSIFCGQCVVVLNIVTEIQYLKEKQKSYTYLWKIKKDKKIFVFAWTSICLRTMPCCPRYCNRNKRFVKAFI